MANLKQIIILSISSLVPASAGAHYDKGTDRNGGHWDSFGYYHCHQANCRQAPDRNDLMPSSRSRLSNRDEDLFYLEEDWPHWIVTGDCQTVRTQILVATSEVPVTYTNPRQCEVRMGKWTDPYTGDIFDRAARLEIDHIIPPMYANASNGYQWDDNKRMQFANDPLNLIAVGRDIHDKKRDRGIGNWRPPQEGFHCDYAIAWRDVALKYDLDLFARDRSRMNDILDECDAPESEFEGGDKKTDVEIRAGGIPIPL